MHTDDVKDLATKVRAVAGFPVAVAQLVSDARRLNPGEFELLAFCDRVESADSPSTVRAVCDATIAGKD